MWNLFCVSKRTRAGRLDSGPRPRSSWTFQPGQKQQKRGVCFKKRTERKHWQLRPRRGFEPKSEHLGFSLRRCYIFFRSQLKRFHRQLHFFLHKYIFWGFFTLMSLSFLSTCVKCVLFVFRNNLIFYQLNKTNLTSKHPPI